MELESGTQGQVLQAEGGFEDEEIEVDLRWRGGEVGERIGGRRRGGRRGGGDGGCWGV